MIMSNFENNKVVYTYEDSAANVMLRKVYLWMTLALCITGLTAYYVAENVMLEVGAFYGCLIAELVLVIALSHFIDKLSAAVATVMFVLYSVLNGVTLSVLFAVYTESSIASTFFITAGTFASMALYGYFTKKDLTKIGNILYMALFGMLIALVVNMFLGNEMLDYIVSFIGVLVFTGLTAYDTQKAKEALYGQEENQTTSKVAVLFALELYLDFINIFLYLLRFFGNRD